MLDVHVRWSLNGQMRFSVFRKTTHMDQYIQLLSNQPLQHTLWVIRQCITDENHLLEWGQIWEKDDLKKVLSVSGYQVRLGYRHQTQSAHHPPGPQHHLIQGQHHIRVHIKDATCRTIRRAGVSVYLTPYNTTPFCTDQGQSSQGRFQRLSHVTTRRCSSHHLTKVIRWPPKASAFHPLL